LSQVTTMSETFRLFQSTQETQHRFRFRIHRFHPSAVVDYRPLAFRHFASYGIAVVLDKPDIDLCTDRQRLGIVAEQHEPAGRPECVL